MVNIKDSNFLMQIIESNKNNNKKSFSIWLLVVFNIKWNDKLAQIHLACALKKESSQQVLGSVFLNSSQYRFLVLL